MEFSGGYSTSAVLVLLSLGESIWGVEIITARHVNVEKKIFNPYSGICRAIVRLDVYEFKPFSKLVLHYLISKAHGVCGSSIPGDIATEFG